MLRYTPTTALLRSTTFGLRFSSTTVDPLLTSLRTALKTHMKARDSVKVSVIKSLLGEISNLQHTANPPPISKMLSKAISARQDAASTFASATPPRQDLAEQYRAEASFLQEFAPAKIAGMTAEELEESVRSVLKALGLETVAGKDMGRVVKGTIELVAGKAEGKEVSEAVKRVISKL